MTIDGAGELSRAIDFGSDMEGKLILNLALMNIKPRLNSFLMRF
jgi:hypothetical protein